MVERENFPSRMSLSLSFFAPNEGSSARQKHRRRRSLSTLSRAFVSIAEKRQRGVCLSSKISARMCSNSRPVGKFNPQKLCALSLSCASLETERRTKNVAREYSRSLDGLAMPAYLSRSRIRECKERERNDPKFVRKLLLFFPRSFISPIKCSQFSQRGWRERNDDALRDPSFRTQHTPGEDDDGEDEEERRELYERVLLSFRLKMCCLLCVMTSNKI